MLMVASILYLLGRVTTYGRLLLIGGGPCKTKATLVK